MVKLTQKTTYLGSSLVEDNLDVKNRTKLLKLKKNRLLIGCGTILSGAWSGEKAVGVLLLIELLVGYLDSGGKPLV